MGGVFLGGGALPLTRAEADCGIDDVVVRIVAVVTKVLRKDRRCCCWFSIAIGVLLL